MIKNSNFCCTILVFAALVLKTSLALQCYECSATKGLNQDCEVDLQNIKLVNCTPGFVCVQSIRTTVSTNETIIQRQCGATNQCEVIQGESSHVLDPQKDTSLVCTTCNDTDGCNSANNFVFNSSMLTMTLMMFTVIIVNALFVK